MEFFDNAILNNKQSIINYNNKKTFFINKNKLNEKRHLDNNRQLSENNLFIFKYNFFQPIKNY